MDVFDSTFPWEAPLVTKIMNKLLADINSSVYKDVKQISILDSFYKCYQTLKN